MDAAEQLLVSMLLGVMSEQDAIDVYREIADDLQDLSSPQTLLNKLQHIVEQRLGRTEPRLLVERFMPNIVNVWRNWANKEIADDAHAQARIQKVEGASALVSFLLETLTNDASPPQVLEAVRSGALGHDLPGMIDSVLPALDPSRRENTFEGEGKRIATAMAGIAEGPYKSSLQSCLLASRLRFGVAERPMPRLLGRVFAECQGLWTENAPDLIPLLHSDVKFVRNSQCHHNTEFDVVAETVLFVNFGNDGVRQELGPMRIEELRRRLDDTADLVMGLHGAFDLVWRRVRMLFQIAGK